MKLMPDLAGEETITDLGSRPLLAVRFFFASLLQAEINRGYIPTVVMLKELCRLSLGWAGQPTDVPDAELEVPRFQLIYVFYVFLTPS